MVELTIDGRKVSVPENTTILEAARSVGIAIPTLCYLKEINEIGSCRICLVEIEGIDQLVAACNNTVLDGMIVHTNSAKVRRARKQNLELILATHDSKCTSCVRSKNCSLQDLARDFNIYYNDYPQHLFTYRSWDKSYPLIRSNTKCIACVRCVQICDKVQDSHVWDLTSRSTHTEVNVAGGKDFTESDCTLCGQCITHCPTGALRERDDTEQVFDALADPDTTCIVQIAPSIRTAWSEAFGQQPSELDLSYLVAALREIGFDYVINTDVSADLTIMEEGSELLEHLPKSQAGGYPLFTSCCPAWVRYVKAHHPELLGDVSTSKSPQQMFGAIVKSYYAEQLGLDPHKVFSVSIMPCVAKKAECSYPTMRDACGDPDVDVVLTTREVIRMIHASHIHPETLTPSDMDNPLDTGSGAGIIFGATGGVMEAALRTCHYLCEGSAPKTDMFSEVRGMQGWKETTYKMGDTPVRVAVVSGLANAGKLCKAILAGDAHYDFVEVMACPGGCVGGGGQPIHDGRELAEKRSRELYRLDGNATWASSYENLAVQRIYADYLGQPLSERAHKLLHTDHTGWSMSVLTKN